MSFDWCRLWHDLPTDPKWRTVARKAGARVADVVAVYIAMLVNASQSPERGTLHNWDNEDIGGALDLEPDAVANIKSAMQGKVLDGDVLTGWEGRQPKREDGSAERGKAWRERNRTQPNETERKRSLDKIRLDKSTPTGGEETFTSDEVPWETASETPTQPPAPQDLPLAPTPPTVTAPSPEVELFRRGKEVLGTNAGGMIRKLLAFHGEVVALARASIELASTKENPREWIGGLLRKGSNEEADREAARRARHTFN